VNQNQISRVRKRIGQGLGEGEETAINFWDEEGGGSLLE
jgi:hypothetical protein